jgi:8-amino-7-oxononanoate synthase
MSMTYSNLLTNKLSAALASRDSRLKRRYLPSPANYAAPNYLDFASNDYLSLTRSPELRELFLQSLSNSPVVLGSSGSRNLVNGAPHADLETRLANMFHSPTALLFNSGFDANVGFFSCIPQPGDTVVHDIQIHASVYDGMRAGRAHHISFPHNNMVALRSVLEELAQKQSVQTATIFVVVETLYSMDGDIAPLHDIIALQEEIFPEGNSLLVVDEAHATGVYGPQGKGIVSMLGVEEKCFARIHTFGKALAASGGTFRY